MFLIPLTIALASDVPNEYPMFQAFDDENVLLKKEVISPDEFDNALPKSPTVLSSLLSFIILYCSTNFEIASVTVFIVPVDILLIL